MIINTSSLQRIDVASELVEVDLNVEVDVLDMEEMHG